MASLRSVAERLLEQDLSRAPGMIPPVMGLEFHPTRRWAFDLAWPDIRLAVEVDGKGRHQTDKGKRMDDEKLNAALEMGWRVLRYPANSLTTHKRRVRIVEQIQRVACGVVSPEDASIVLVGD